MKRQYLQLHPISEAPSKDGAYDLFDDKSGAITHGVPWYKKEGWGFEAHYHTHWLSNEPVTGVLVSEEELREALCSAYNKGYNQNCDDPDIYIDNLINSLTNKSTQ